MTRRRICSGIVFLCMLAVVLLSACGMQPGAPQKYTGRGYKRTVITTPKMGDAKLIKDKIISGSDGHMILLNQDGTIFREYADIPLNWLYVYEPENLVVAGSWGNEPHLVALDDDWTVNRNEAIPMRSKTGTQMIDPTLVKANGTYILTCVEIEGSINNGDAGAENGTYTVKCMKSENLSDWEMAADILSYPNNIEDGDMIFQNGTLYYFYEKEEFDKGPSSINVAISKDYGMSWQDEAQLLAADADHELASVEPGKDGYVVYYSSDEDSAGASYDGAKAYRASFTEDFQAEDICEVDLGEDGGILLYDTKQARDGMYYLYARNYCKENDLVLVFGSKKAEKQI
ncbi:MAG: hypothetical protein K2N87_06705 [Eubacterium sp.]|nr:hypothetical protein [Eubacterium sp.]